MSRRRLALVGISACILPMVGWLAYASYRDGLYDSRFDTKVENPAYPGRHPRVLFDEAHANHHTAAGRYRPFADLIADDGYEVRRGRSEFTPEALGAADVLVIACARGRNDANDAPAFGRAEVEAVDRWVRGGGSLLLITDHYPFGPAAEELAGRFGIGMSGGLVEDSLHFEPSLESSHIVFSRENGLLADHPIARGRGPSERLSRVLSFTGQSIRGPAGAAPLLSLGASAVDRPASARVEKSGGDVRVIVNYGEPVPAAGRAAGVALEVDKGRVVVLGEAGMLSAQRDKRGRPVGMNFPGYDNRQLALNIMHWLSRAL